MRKIVLDTSAVIKDPNCFRCFGESDVFVPLTVVEELDHIKEGHGEKAAMARRFIKELDAMSYAQLINFPGVSLGDDKGTLSVAIADNALAEVFAGGALDFSKADNQILSTCIMVDMVYNGNSGDTVLISEDRNLRIKARSIGVNAEGCASAVKECACCGVQCLEDVPIGVIQDLFASNAGVDPIIFRQAPAVNEFMMLRNGSTSALATCCRDNKVRRIRAQDAFGITPRNAEQSFSLCALLDNDIPLVALTGKAGTGKTLLALAAALEQRSQYRQIMLARPVIELGKGVGFLPGDIKEKMAPYMQPFYDNLATIRYQGGTDAATKIGKMIDEEKIVMEPLTYIRGRSLTRMFLIVDEAQNLTPHEVKTIITRAGEGTKIVFTGDMRQIDNENLDVDSNGLAYLVARLRGEALFAHVGLSKGERSALAELASEKL